MNDAFCELLVPRKPKSKLLALLIPKFREEYEYYLLNYTLEITLIQNKENRRDITEFDIRKAELVAPADSPKLTEFHPTKILDCSSGIKGSKSYAIIIYLEEELHKILIEPDEKMTEQMKMWLGPKMIL